MKFLIKFLIIIVISSKTFSQIYTDEDISIFNSKIQLAEKNNLSQLPINQIISFIGKSFISTPYEAHTLEITDDEELIINLRTLDCTTFLETVFAISLCVKNQKTSFDDFKDYLRKIRYRDGLIKDYTSRLHYFSDWIFHNQRKNLIEDVTERLGGIKVSFKLNYMTSNHHLYKHLKNNQKFINIMKKIENEISNRNYFYLAADDIRKIEEKILEGDFIAFTTNQKGLDIGHVGIAVKGNDNRIYLLHAPEKGSYVQITDEPLQGYVKKVKKHTGIIVLRAIN
ncbi:MAG: DUF1460 domain-containing protein [Ignavibacterium sp.]|nr:DUF1460 domain-containing protein [Ignavibacterium sp.]